MSITHNSVHLKTVISGSYRKHLSSLIELKKLLEEIGIEVLSPHGSYAINPKDEFIFLDSDPIQDRHILQDSVFAKIRSSSFLVVANVDGYIGNAALMEMGYSIAYNLQIFTFEDVEDPNLSPYCKPLSIIIPKLKKYDLVKKRVTV